MPAEPTPSSGFRTALKLTDCAAQGVLPAGRDLALSAGFVLHGATQTLVVLDREGIVAQRRSP